VGQEEMYRMEEGKKVQEFVFVAPSCKQDLEEI
jgi:hypothetical protein